MYSGDGVQKAKCAWLPGVDCVYAHRLAHHKQDAILAADLYARGLMWYYGQYTPQDVMFNDTSWLWRCSSVPQFCCLYQQRSEDQHVPVPTRGRAAVSTRLLCMGTHFQGREIGCVACACRFRLASEEKTSVEDRALQQESQISRLQSQLASQSSTLADKAHSVSRLAQLGALATKHVNMCVYTCTYCTAVLPQR